ncbi:MAG: transporter [Pseudomonadota bacterium]
MRRIGATVAALVAVGIWSAAPVATAKEGGDQYPNGAESWLAGAVPPPGNYFVNYLGYYEGSLRDGSGNKTSFPGTGRNGSVRASFDALRFIKVTNTKIFGANWGFHAIVPLANQTLDLGAPNGSRSASDMGDITINPLILSWHSPEWHWVFGFDINMPTGKYDKNDGRVSIGANYYSYEPAIGVTYLGKSGWEASAKFMYNMKGKNTDSNLMGVNGSYQSGDEFHMDYMIGKRFGPWGVGVAGYYLKQLQDDKFNGATVAAVPGLWSQGRRGEVFAIGPSVIYTTAKGMMFIGTWNNETNVENRFGGDKVWFKLVMPF